MNEIKKQGLERMLLRHQDENTIEKIQQIVNCLIETVLCMRLAH